MTRAPMLALAAGAATTLAGGLALLGTAHRHDTARLAACREHEVLDRPCPTTSTRARSADGTELHVRLAGPEDARPIVLLHGWGMSGRFWHYQIRDLAADHRVVVPDLRGHGRSGPPGALGATFAGLTADLDAVLDTAVRSSRTGGQPLLVGHSLGGMTLIDWAGGADDPARRAHGLVLLNTACREATAGRVSDRPRLGRVAAAVNRATIASPAGLPPTRTPVSHRAVRLLAHGPGAAPSHVALTEELFLACDRHVRADFGRLLGSFDLTAAAGRLTVPTTVVLGTRDRLIAPGFSRSLARAIPHAELVELPGVGHQAPLEAHAEVTGLLRRLAV